MRSGWRCSPLPQMILLGWAPGRLTEARWRAETILNLSRSLVDHPHCGQASASLQAKQTRKTLEKRKRLSAIWAVSALRESGRAGSAKHVPRRPQAAGARRLGYAPLLGASGGGGAVVATFAGKHSPEAAPARDEPRHAHTRERRSCVRNGRVVTLSSAIRNRAKDGRRPVIRGRRRSGLMPRARWAYDRGCGDRRPNKRLGRGV